ATRKRPGALQRNWPRGADYHQRCNHRWRRGHAGTAASRTLASAAANFSIAGLKLVKDFIGRQPSVAVGFPYRRLETGLQLPKARLALLYQTDAFAQDFALGIVAAVFNEVSHHLFEVFTQFGTDRHGTCSAG